MVIRVNILADSIIAGDAVGRHNVDVARALVAGRLDVRIYYENLFSRQEKDIQSISTRISDINAIPEADVTILQYAGWFPLAEQFKTAIGARVFWYHGVTPPDLWGTQIDQDLLVRSRFGARLVHASDVAVADSPFGGEELGRLTNYPRDRILTIPISTDLGAFHERPSEGQLASLRRHLHIENRDVLLYVGRLAGNKRVDLLVSALHLLRNRFPTLILLIVGDSQSNQAYSDYADKIRQYARSLELSDRVILTGKVPSVSEYYHLASVFGLASEHEGFGVPLVEAMAAGVPVVASRSTAIPWVLGYTEQGDAPAGLIFTAGAAEELAECISTVLLDKTFATALAERGRVRSLYFTPDYFTETTVKLLNDTLEKRRKDPGIRNEPNDYLSGLADVALREYRIRSRIPIFGRLIERIRYNMTVHVKEAYLDRIVERQVMFNLSIMDQLRKLKSDIGNLESRISSDAAVTLTTQYGDRASSGLDILDRNDQLDAQMIHRAIEIGAKSRDFCIEQENYLADLADVALRNYHVHSRVPLFGRLIEWIRFNLTVHIKEAYLDRIIERQVGFNTTMVGLVRDLQSDIHNLESHIGRRR
ncbi:MAG: glycosyltransferase family 4 protein [Anaerolineae bacterium]